MLTAVEIRAVGPGTWNSWKRQLLGELYDAGQERLRLGHMRHGRKQRVGAKQEAVAQLLGRDTGALSEADAQFDDAYWIAEPDDVIALNLPQFESALEADDRLSIRCHYYEARGARSEEHTSELQSLLRISYAVFCLQTKKHTV